MTMKTRLALAFGLVVGLLAPSTWAAALFLESDSSNGTFKTASLTSPTGIAATLTLCLKPPSASRTVTVVWIPSPSLLTDGYEVERASGLSAFSLLARVGGAASSSFVDSTPAASTVYNYRVKSTYYSWVSQPSASVTLTTPAANCK